jgi:hypothetical protein
MEMTPLPMSSVHHHQTHSNVIQQSYQSHQSVPSVTPRHQVVAQLQQIQMQQQQQQQEYYNPPPQPQQQQKQQQQQQQQQRRRQVSRDSSRWSLLDEDDAGDRDDCGEQVRFNSINFVKLFKLKLQQMKCMYVIRLHERPSRTF